MPAFARVIPWLVLVFSLAGLALGFFEWSHPPFTDAQIKASAADTWEVATSTTRVFCVVCIGLGFVCVTLARRSRETGPRAVALFAAAACVLTLTVFLRNHVELTRRTEQLTGQPVGAVFGLF